MNNGFPARRITLYHRNKMKKLIMLFVCGLLFIMTSCHQDDEIVPVEQKHDNALKSRALDKNDLLVLNKFLQINGDSLSLGDVAARTSAPLSGYTYFSSTGNNDVYFAVGAYGVEITRTWSDPSSISVWPLVQASTSSYWGYTSLLKLDASNNVISSQLNKNVNSSDTRPFSSVSISGSQKVWLIFWPKVNGTYKYWYE